MLQSAVGSQQSAVGSQQSAVGGLLIAASIKITAKIRCIRVYPCAIKNLANSILMNSLFFF